MSFQSSLPATEAEVEIIELLDSHDEPSSSAKVDNNNLKTHYPHHDRRAEIHGLQTQPRGLRKPSAAKARPKPRKVPITARKRALSYSSQQDQDDADDESEDKVVGDKGAKLNAKQVSSVAVPRKNAGARSSLPLIPGEDVPPLYTNNSKHSTHWFIYLVVGFYTTLNFFTQLFGRRLWDTNLTTLQSDIQA